ncbi:MAG: sensor histidine kinase, partial [Stackebrandtia sp.]
RRREHAEEESRRHQAEAQAARMAERTRIARDLHDIVAHHVGAMVLRAGAAQYAGAPPLCAEALGDIRETGTRALEDLRGLMSVLRDPNAVEETLSVVDLDEVANSTVGRVSAAGLDVRLALDPAADSASSMTRAAAARVVQEGLTNALKHAGPGTRARVEVKVDEPNLLVLVENDAPASPTRQLPSTGYGVAGLRERVSLLGGRLDSGPGPRGGWRLAAEIPLRSNT